MSNKAKQLGNEPVNHVDEIYFKEDCGKIGLTKREYFAAMAMQGLIVGIDHYDEDGEFESMETTPFNHAANLSVKYADALLEELSKD